MLKPKLRQHVSAVVAHVVARIVDARPEKVAVTIS
jgi:hypothetical protein